MSRTTLIDRRNAGTPQRAYSLDGKCLHWQEADGETVGQLPLDGVRQVRLAVEMAGRESQVVCRLSSEDGTEIAFGSMRWAGVGLWEANARDFRDFLTELHRDLAEQAGPVRYIEGSSMAFLAIMAGLGGVLALVGAGFFAKLFLIDENAIGLVLIPAIALGLWLMRLFWPRAAKDYDPARYIEASADETAVQADESGATVAEKEGSVTSR
ncbi:hypothetical protein [Maricaulis sp.]|uniref:hypothetical protein n=1 Tax=Maricaulis sp. TaxID=1486257 RepID=UPI00260F8E2A|nr:hypothetical protein [Maricaulis sp.]MDF1767619.1 hypothetical protein [Maricaulis sp.]